MILIPHSIVGAAITNLLPNNPVLGFGLAFASHYFLDFIPHKDYEVEGFIDENTKTVKSVFTDMKTRLHFLLIGADFFVAIILCFIIFVRGDGSLHLTLLGIIAGVLPDFLQFLYLKWKRQPWIFTQKVHDIFHSPNKMKDKIVLGYVLQVVVIILSVSIYFWLK